MKNIIFSTLTSFAAVCVALGKNEQDYAINPSDSNVVNEAMSRKRLLLLAEAANGDKKVDLLNTAQWKYTPWHRIILDDSGPFGFRLSCDVFDFGISNSSLGARPPFLRSSDATHAGQQFVEEFEQWMYYLNKVYQE